MQYAKHRFYGRVKPSYEQRKREMQRLYQEDSPERAGSNWSVIQCYHRAGLTLQDTAEILNLTEAQVEFALDIIQQNAQ